MAFPLPSRLHLPAIAFAVAAGMSCLSTTAFAQDAPEPSTGDTIRLTDEQREAILNQSTEDRAAAARGELVDSKGPGPGIHGEVGAMIGSNGTRGIYGTAAIPLGDNAGAIVSFESSRFGYPDVSRSRAFRPGFAGQRSGDAEQR